MKETKSLKKAKQDGPFVILIRKLGTEPGISLGYSEWRAHTPQGLICQVIGEMCDVLSPYVGAAYVKESKVEAKTLLRANVAAYLLRTFDKPDAVLKMSEQIDADQMKLIWKNEPIPQAQEATP